MSLMVTVAMYCPQASDLDVYRQEGRNAMSRANVSAASGRTTNAGKGTEQRVGRAPRGAEKVTVPFPDAGADRILMSTPNWLRAIAEQRQNPQKHRTALAEGRVGQVETR